MKALRKNSKTFRSLDLTTDCPKRRAGNPCPYCYVEQGRELGYNPARVIDKCIYNGDILRMSQSTIDKLNSAGGLRLFSLGDYMPWMNETLKQVIGDAQKRGLKLKAITKQPEFISKYARHGILIHYSADMVGNSVPANITRLKRKYSNVKIRYMARNADDVQAAIKAGADIITPFHGPRPKLADGSRDSSYRPREAKQAALELAPDKTCCNTGSCLTCSVKCGAE